jgi:hypothetical protein
MIMATASESTTTPKATTTSTTPATTESEVPEVSAEDIKKVMEDPRFDLPSFTVTTAEDAYQAFLQERIDETELRAVVAATGNVKFAALKNNLERPDNAYARQIPEDLYDDPSLAVSSLEDRLKAVEERDKAAEEATAAAEETTTPASS